MKNLIVAALIALAGTGIAQADDYDLAAGEKVFKKCMACHAVGADAKNKVGPELNGIVGRAVASVEGFKYSTGADSMTEWGAGKTWDKDTLDAYLAKPKDVVKKTKMAFAGLPKEDDRENVIAYLASFAADGSAADPAAVLGE